MRVAPPGATWERAGKGSPFRGDIARDMLGPENPSRPSSDCAPCRVTEYYPGQDYSHLYQTHEHDRAPDARSDYNISTINVSFVSS